MIGYVTLGTAVPDADASVDLVALVVTVALPVGVVVLLECEKLGNRCRHAHLVILGCA